MIVIGTYNNCTKKKQKSNNLFFCLYPFFSIYLNNLFVMLGEYPATNPKINDLNADIALKIPEKLNAAKLYQSFSIVTLNAKSSIEGVAKVNKPLTIPENKDPK